MAAHGTFSWRELMTNDVAKAKAFYGATLGWTFDDMPMQTGTRYMIHMSGAMMEMMNGMGEAMGSGTMNGGGDMMLHFTTATASEHDGHH